MKLFDKLFKRNKGTEFMMIGDFQSKGITYDVVIFKETDEFMVPHMHIANRDNRNEEYISKILVPEYYDHGRENYQMMDRDLNYDFGFWLYSTNPDFNGSNWDRAVFNWIALNKMSDEDIKISEKGSPNFLMGIK